MTVSTETLRRIVSLAAHAPSGDNSQPLRFHWDGRRLRITHDEARGEHPFNTHHTLSYLTLGCTLEAIAVAAESEGLQAHVELNEPSHRAVSAWAEIAFAEATRAASGSVSALLNRCTDRRPYRGGSLDDRVFEELATRAPTRDRVRLRFRPPTAELLSYLTGVETLIWTWGPTHRGIAKWFRLSRREAEATRDGMTRQSMAIDPVSALLLRLGRADFRVQRVLNRIGFLSRFRSRVRSRIGSAAAIGCVTVEGPTMETVVEAARLVMKAWLGLNASGYGFQALSAASELILDHSRGLLPKSLPPPFHDAAAEGRELLARIFELGERETPAWIFRTGLALTPPAGSASPRLPLSELLTIDEQAPST